MNEVPGAANSQRMPTFDRAANRTFGLVFAGLFCFISLLRFWKGKAGGFALLGLSLALVLIAQFAPNLLKPLNRAWMKLGDLMHKVMSPLILGLIFFGFITPISFLKRVFGSDSMNRSFDESVSSYWIPRDPRGPKPETMRQQF